MAYTYDRSPSGDTLHITRCEQGHVQLIVTSGVGGTTVPVCIAPADLEEVVSQIQAWGRSRKLYRRPLAWLCGED